MGKKALGYLAVILAITAVVLAMIALRGALTFLIHWEIKNEETKMSE